MDEDERRRKLEAGRAKKSSNMPRNQTLASFRQKRAKSDSAGEAKKTQKRKGSTVAQNDGSTQDRRVEPVPPSATDTELNRKTNHEQPQKPAKSVVQQKQRQMDEPPTLKKSPSPSEDLRHEELLALTGKEQLKQLQEAVEKRNEIIAKLSSNLQDALASRDQVQLEAQSLAGQIQALQRQLQQTSVEFLRIKTKSDSEVLNTHRQQLQHGHGSQEADLNNKEAPTGGSGSEGPASQSSVEGFNSDSDPEINIVLHKLRAELEEEREKSRQICAELSEELEKHQHVLALLESEKNGREADREEKEAQLQDLQNQLSQVQSQCLEMQQCKEEKEKLNREVLELRKRLQEEEDAERRLSEKVATSALRLQSLEEERQRQEEEMQMLKEDHRGEVERVRQLLGEREKELKFREEEVMGLKVSKNRQNQAKAGFSCDESIGADEANLESGPNEDSMNVSIPGDIMMERYFFSVPLGPSQSSLVNESLEHCSQLDVSADHSFELNSEVFGEEPLLSISKRLLDANDTSSMSIQQCHDLGTDNSNPQGLSLWFHNSTSGNMDRSKLSEEQFKETDLEKELLNQQCDELREELALKDRDLNVLKEEVDKSAEELEEARSRWAQVTEELRQALWELEEEKEKRRHVEEEMNEQDLNNKLSALMEGGEKEKAAMLLGKEAAETLLLAPDSVPSENEDKPMGELEKEPGLPSHQKQPELLVSSLQEIMQSTEPDNQLQTLQAHCDRLISELEETKTKLTAASCQGTSDETLKELETTHAQLLDAAAEVERLQNELDRAEKEKDELESQILCLRQNMANLEEAQAQAVQEREEHTRKEEEMDEQIKKMEQVLEEELEQFESLLKSKDVKLAEAKEKWEEERQEKKKELLDMKHLMEEQRRQRDEEVLAVEEVREKLMTSHQQEKKDLMEKHQQEISELKAQQKKELLKQQTSMEEEQKRQIGLIKQVTEREHERVVSELTVEHSEELSQLKTELSLEVRDSLEAAHQAELQQAQAQKTIELEALRQSLTNVHMSQLEHLQESAVTKLQPFLKETFAQETASLQAQHQVELDQLRQKDQEQLDRLRELHQRDMDEFKQQWETRVAEERSSMEEKQAKEIQALRLQWETEAQSARSNLLTSLSETENRRTATQTELTSTQTSLTQVNKSLSEAQAALLQTQSELKESQARLEELQISSKEENQKLEEELNQAWADRDAAASSLEELVSSQKGVLQEKGQQVLQLEEREQQLLKEIFLLQEEKTLLKKKSDEEVAQLWTQLDSMRTSRQELGELKEQLLARSSRVDDIERLKTEFNEQKQGIKEQNEAELESLRRYFEQRLQATEESYREEIALLQLRMVESALEESLNKTADDSSISHDDGEEAKYRLSDTSLKLETHKEMEEKHSMELANLRSSLNLSFEEQVQQVRSDLTDHYYEELQDKKTRHALEMEQLKAKLSENHLQELTRIHLEAARQVEAEVELRLWCHTEELQTRMTMIHTLEDRLAALSEQHDAEMQNAQKRMTTELNTVLQEQSEEQLRQAQERFHEEKTLLERRLVQTYENSVAELKNKLQMELEHERKTLLNKHSQEMDTIDAKHKAQLDSLSASHRDQLVAKGTDLESKHNAEIVALEAALNSKQMAELKNLEAMMQETSQVQLEALEAQLTREHQEERDVLEKRMLGNMDTLEATYLKEVQTLRDEVRQLEEKHAQDLNHQKSECLQIIEHHAAEQLSIREELRTELAQMHMEKFSAMAAELSHVHKAELAAQKESSDNEHCTALETLKMQVLELEHHHNAALRELSHTYSAEKEQLIKQHQLQLQELRGISARELEACRRELEEESSRQRQHFIEEVELLKVQSEDRINQLKTEFEEQKKAELQDLRRSFTSEQEKKEQSYTGKMSQLTSQLQQLDAVVAQLRSEVGCLQGELEGKRAEMETLDTLLQRRDREGQEGSNHLKMLSDDLQTAKEERYNLLRANEKLSMVLIEIVRSTVATEELIGQKISTRTNTSQQATHQKSSAGIKDADESGITVSELSSEDVELTQLFCESLLVSDTQISPGGEEAALNACGRLRHAVGTLLELLNQANTHLEQTHDVHLSLEEKFSQGREDSAQLLKQHKLLLEQLDQEAKLKSQLQLELHKAEGLLEGYMAEKVVLEECLQQREAQEERLAEELEDLKVKLHQMGRVTVELDSLRLKHQELSEEHTILLRQKEHLSAGLGDREKALLAETERLTQDRLDLQRQAERDHRSLSQRLRALERDLEEQETKGLETELHNKTHSEDLNQHVQALEKQLKHDRQFIEEQAVEREHERDEFQQEIRRLEAQLRQTGSVDNKGHRFEDLALQVESLQAIIKDKIDDHASLSAANQQAQRDLAERNEEIDKLAVRIRELEHALLNTAESNQSVGQLEQELHRGKLREQELTQDKQALEQQQLSNRLQISALQSKLDDMRHCYHDNSRDPTQELRDALDTAQQSLQTKEKKVEVLLDQLENVQRDLSIKEVELKHLTLQLESLTNQNAAHVNELQEQIAALKETVSCLKILEEEREDQSEMTEVNEETLPSALLQEKNQEIDHLNNEMQRLQQELENTRDNKDLEVELENLGSQVEHLQSEITRVRQDKEEEEERLHEVISTLQAELATLGPNVHEVSDSQDGDSVNPSPAPSPEPHHYTIQEQEKRGGPSSLKHELNLTHSAASRSLRSRLKATQSQLETAVAEREGLERLLLIQEEDYRGEGQEMGRKLKVVRERADELQGLLTLTEAELEEVKAQLEQDMDKRKSSEDTESLHKENAHLNTLVTDLQEAEQERQREITSLKEKEHEMKLELEALRQTSLTLERQIQEMRAKEVDIEKLSAVEKEKIKMLETAKEELSAEIEALRSKEKNLREETERLRQEVISMRGLIQDLTVKLNEKETNQEETQKEVLTNAEVTLAQADTALRYKEEELVRLRAEHMVLRTQLTTVKRSLSTSAARAEKLQEEGQTKDCALVDLETDNQRLKSELRRLQEDLAVQEKELAYQRRELQRLQQYCQQQATLNKDISQRPFEDIVSVSRDEASLSSPELLRRLECSEDRIPECFHASVLDSRLSELSVLNSTGLDLPQHKTSPRVAMEPPHSRTITPDPATRSTHSLGSASILDSLDADRLRELEGLDVTAPPSPLGSTSSLSAPEWASDGYGSNVSSELGARLRVELDQTEKLDARFVEYLRCRGLNQMANTDSVAGSMSYSDDLLSPELQNLLKKVYQESSRILTLSQRRATASPQTKYLGGDSATLMDKSTSNPPMSWEQERRALQETVIALRELLCRMAHTQTDGQIESQLKAELEEKQKQLQHAHDSQRELRLAVEDCKEALKQEKTRIQELQQQQQQLEQERALSLHQDREERERREAMQVSSGQQRSEIMALKSHVEQERVASSNLRRELQIEHSRSELLEKRVDDTQKELEDERKCSAQQYDLFLKEKTRLQGLLTEAESRSCEIHSKLAVAHRKLDEERDRCSMQLDELSSRHEADSDRDRKCISDMRCQLQIQHSRTELLEKQVDDTQKELEDERKCSAQQYDLFLKEKTRLQGLLTEVESRSCEIHSKLAVAHRKLDEERDRCSWQVDELSRRHEADTDRDRKLVSDMHGQLEQERRKGEELAAEMVKLRTELLQNKRKWEKEDITRREELQREQEAATRHCVGMEAMKEQKQEASRALEVERQQSKRLVVELVELKERFRLMKDKEREREEQWERERRKGRQDQIERERNQERTNNKLCELELLSQQDQQRMQELQQTLAELQREEREMAAQRMSGWTTGQQLKPASSQKHLQTGTQISSTLLEKLLRENSELTERLTLLSQERATHKHRLACMERQLRHSENKLTKAMAETENRPINDVISNSKVQRLYERYLRAESFRKALVYQKRYLLLLLGGFQESEQVTMSAIARMGARPSSQLSDPHRPIRRFRAAVQVVIALLRMKFLTTKWQKVIRRLSLSGTVTVHAPGAQAEVLRQQQSRSNHNSSPNRDTVSALVPPSKSPFRLPNRSYSSTVLPSGYSGVAPQDLERSPTEYIQHLENVQQRLIVPRQVSHRVPKEERRIRSACSPDMIGYRQRWLQENRTWLYLSCLSPLYLYGPGSPVLQFDQK